MRTSVYALSAVTAFNQIICLTKIHHLRTISMRFADTCTPKKHYQDRDHIAVSLDLEKSLEERDPPGQNHALSMLSGDRIQVLKAVPIGNALLHSHRLESMDCQCR
jgi:hypothetical protein